jgi:hypothetical protein
MPVSIRHPQTRDKKLSGVMYTRAAPAFIPRVWALKQPAIKNTTF